MPQLFSFKEEAAEEFGRAVGRYLSVKVTVRQGGEGRYSRGFYPGEREAIMAPGQQMKVVSKKLTRGGIAGNRLEVVVDLVDD